MINKQRFLTLLIKIHNQNLIQQIQIIDSTINEALEKKPTNPNQAPQRKDETFEDKSTKQHKKKKQIMIKTKNQDL